MNLSDLVRKLQKDVRELTKLVLNIRASGGGGVGPHNILSVTHPDATAAAVLRGALITGQGVAPTWKRLSIGAAGYLLRSDGTDVVWDDISGVGGAPDDAEYIVGAAHADLLNERVKPALYDNFDLADYPAAPSAWDDEFEDGAIDPKWTAMNNPAAPRSFSESKFAGFVWVQSIGSVISSWDTMVGLYQTTIPSSAARWMFIARVALGNLVVAATAEYAHAGVFLGDSVTKDAVMGVLQLTPVTDAAVAGMARIVAIDANVYVAATIERRQTVDLTKSVWIGLSKETNNAYTSANDYWAWMSVDGIVWHVTGLRTFTFSTSPDRIGLSFRRAAAVAADIEYAVDSFRKTV